MKKREPIPTKYWRYCFRRLNGKRTYVKIKKVRGKVKIRVAQKRS
jgi:hypothetical protein